MLSPVEKEKRIFVINRVNSKYKSGKVAICSRHQIVVSIRTLKRISKKLLIPKRTKTELEEFASFWRLCKELLVLFISALNPVILRSLKVFFPSKLFPCNFRTFHIKFDFILKMLQKTHPSKTICPQCGP